MILLYEGKVIFLKQVKKLYSYVLSLIENAKIKINAILDRKFTAKELSISRLDYPERDEEDILKYQTMHLEDGKIVFGRLPIRFWGNMKEEYEAHNKDYTGVYKPE